MSVEAVGTARRGRRARKDARAARDFTMLPALKRKLPLTEVMDQEQVERIDAASMGILEDVGVTFRDPLDGSIAWNAVLAPTIAISLFSAAFFAVSVGLRTITDPRTRQPAGPGPQA